MLLTVTAWRSSTYEREIDVLPDDTDALLDLVMDIANGDEIDGTTDTVHAWLGETEVL